MFDTMQMQQNLQLHKIQQTTLTVILLVETFKDQPKLLLVVPQVMHKLLKVQLTIQVFISSFHNFLK